LLLYYFNAPYRKKGEKTMKKFFSALLILTLSLTLLAGCGSNDKGLSRGKWDNDTFKNSYSSLTFNLPEGWTVGTDEELAAVTGIGVELLGEAGVAVTEEQLEQQAIYDMYTYDVEGNNIIVSYENISYTVSDPDSFTEQDYLDAVASMVSLYGASVSDPSEYKIGGNTYVAAAAEYEAVLGMNQYYFVRKIENYMLTIIVTTTTADIDDVMSNFS